MKLVLKFTLVIGLGLVAVLLVSASLRIEREIALFRDDMRHDHQVLGQTLGRAVAEVWRLKGRAVALDVVEHANAAHGSVTVRWVDLDAPAGSPHAPRAPAAELSPLRSGRSAELLLDQGDGLLCTYIPIGSATRGALEISEPLTHQKRYVATTIGHTALTTGMVAAVSVALAFLVGSWIVGRPIRALEDRARRVGAGDLSSRLNLGRSDELGGLAEELNAMCEQLDCARQRVQDETAARIATLEQLRHADRLNTVGKLAAGVAHELGTPLNVVQGRADMIQTGEVVGDEALDSARIIKEQAQRMARTVRDLMQFARQRRPEPADSDLLGVAHDTVSLLRPVAEKNRVGLRLSPATVPVHALVDAAQLQQVLTNLVMNSIQASAPGDTVEIDVGRETRASPPELGGAETQTAFIRVTDHGVGMAPDVANRVFEPFFTTKGVGEGTGLGLAVCFGIIREHRGWLAVESEPGQGSRFTVFLPEAR